MFCVILRSAQVAWAHFFRKKVPKLKGEHVCVCERARETESLRVAQPASDVEKRGMWTNKGQRKRYKARKIRWVDGKKLWQERKYSEGLGILKRRHDATTATSNSSSPRSLWLFSLFSFHLYPSGCCLSKFTRSPLLLAKVFALSPLVLCF